MVEEIYNNPIPIDESAKPYVDRLARVQESAQMGIRVISAKMGALMMDAYKEAGIDTAALNNPHKTEEIAEQLAKLRPMRDKLLARAYGMIVEDGVMPNVGNNYAGFLENLKKFEAGELAGAELEDFETAKQAIDRMIGWDEGRVKGLYFETGGDLTRALSDQIQGAASYGLNSANVKLQQVVQDNPTIQEKAGLGYNETVQHLSSVARMTSQQNLEKRIHDGFGHN